MSQIQQDKKTVKYMDINGKEFEAPNVLVVHSRKRNKINKCRCRHPKYDPVFPNGEREQCCFGRCRHLLTDHPIVRRLTQF